MPKNPTSERPLDPGEFNAYMDAVEAMPPFGIVPDPRRVTLMTAWTGIHPHVFAHPYVSGLRMREDAHVAFIRPKNSRAIAIPAWPGGEVFGRPRAGIREWAAEFIASLPRETCAVPVSARRGRRVTGTASENRPYCECYIRITRAVKRVSEAARMPDVTARTLRHTFGAILYVASGGDVFLVSDWLGCTLEVARRYARQDWSGFGRRFASGDLSSAWGPGTGGGSGLL